MKKQLSILSLGLALTGYNLGFSQETKIQPCNTYEAMEAHFKADPAARANYEAVQKKFQEEYMGKQNASTGFASRTASATPQYTIPVVFHILHQGGPENIADSVCVNALAEVNRVYARETVDTASIFTPFKSLYINSNIKFMLAKKDPNGNCINGIVRHVDAKTNWDQASANNSSSYWSYTWDPTQYLNVYLVGNIVASGTVTGNGIIVGYTYLAGTWSTGSAHDAVVYRYNFLSPNPPSYDARSLAHEMGHWLNLAHTFGNTNNPGVACGSTSGGDGVADTPDTKGSFGTCPNSSTNTAYTCTSPDPSNSNLYYQNVQNIMDYSGCPRNFTTGQTNRMQAVLSSTNNIAGRNNVWSASNLSSSFTDVNGTTLCAPTAQFLSSNNSYTVCSGGSLIMKDASSNGPISSWQWSADNGATVASPTASFTSILFNSVGTTNVTMQVTNAQGSNSQVISVTVLDGTPAINGPYSESFENQGAGLPANWSMVNNPSNTNVWQQTFNAALDGSYSYYVDGTTLPGNYSGSLQMPIMDLADNPNAAFSFAYAYARQNSSQNDVFKLQLSKDCGANWTDVITLGAAIMQQNSGGITSAPYVPAQNEWKTVVASDGTYPAWNTFANAPSVIARFTFIEGSAGYGNDFYLDLINLKVSTVGINELTKSIKLNMYPNPTNGETDLSFTLSTASSIKVSVLDVLGKDVLPAAEYNLGSGDHSIAVNKDNSLSKGVYFVNLSVNGAKMLRKLVIN